MSTSATSWAAEEVDLQSQITENPDGTKTIVSYKLNDQGQKIKVTQKIKLVKVTETVDPAVAARRKWSRFGNEKSNTTIGPDNSTTIYDTEVQLILGSSWKQDALKQAEEDSKASVKKQSTLKCRICQGEHFTSKCPYKDTLGEDAPGINKDSTESDASIISMGAGGASSYVPPHMRSRNGGIASPDERRERDDSTTLRVTNLNSVVDEEILASIFGKFGSIRRVTVVRNRETRESKGFGYVEFDTIKNAETAMEHLDGKGFMNLILKIDWSKPKK
ncbi:hypothetical protein CANARDRAFT_194092 [[Candida] arabinofermentans NRRL YB-2248]|uniref:Eukaryotic translation initiation factor 3 subunit G n=1 Tax=[Candida] arabinofermentans NRRL YB-2248 TaxID=983967 RepID=A0A1E4T5S2_9ASCO|nr:hypothetical protein CANARDRAFT_194092 [[Candida] arabinofermentans NRRL YB-2248]